VLQIHKWLALLAALFTSAGFISIYIRVMGLEKVMNYVGPIPMSVQTMLDVFWQKQKVQ